LSVDDFVALLSRNLARFMTVMFSTDERSRQTKDNDRNAAASHHITLS